MTQTNNDPFDKKQLASYMQSRREIEHFATNLTSMKCSSIKDMVPHMFLVMICCYSAYSISKQFIADGHTSYLLKKQYPQRFAIMMDVHIISTIVWVIFVSIQALTALFKFRTLHAQLGKMLIFPAIFVIASSFFAWYYFPNPASPWFKFAVGLYGMDYSYLVYNGFSAVLFKKKNIIKHKRFMKILIFHTIAPLLLPIGVQNINLSVHPNTWENRWVDPLPFQQEQNMGLWYGITVTLVLQKIFLNSSFQSTIGVSIALLFLMQLSNYRYDVCNTVDQIFSGHWNASRTTLN